MPTGIVKHWSERGFGFIRSDDGERFFHVSDFRGDQDTIERDLEVVFDIGQGRDGRPVAVNVRPVNGAAAIVFGDR